MEKKCNSCGFEGINKFLDLGKMPPVNAFILEEEIPNEKSFSLSLAYCPHCHLVQLEEIAPPEELFKNYLHLSSGSESNIKHLQEVAEHLSSKFKIDKGTKILEIGSNDGTLLSFFKKYTNNVLGVDPAKNLAELNEKKGVEYISEFFNTSLASKIVETQGKFDLIIALNVIPHTKNNIDLLKATRLLMKDAGGLVMEGVYALDTILNGEFDTIYHEHAYTFSMHSLISTFRFAGLTIVNVEKIPTQGGSLRIFAVKDEFADGISESVKKLFREEKEKGIANYETYAKIGKKVQDYKSEMRKILENEKNNYGKLIGLGAPARGVVILNYCGLGINDLEYLIDDTPLKQGKVAPGVHIPVKSWDELKSYKNQTFLLLSWNYKEHLLSKLKKYLSSFRVIIPFPNLEVIEIG